MMIRRFKSLIIGICSTIFCLWWLGINNQSVHERFYTREDYGHDVSKIYEDLGKISEERHDLLAAINAYTIALDAKPDLLTAYDRLGICHERLGNKNAALQTYFKAIHINPNFIEARFSKDKLPPLATLDRQQLLSKKAWTGEPLKDKTLYVFAEKGLGDTLQFCRFLPELKQQGARVLFKPQEPLFKLLQQSNLEVEIIEHSVNPTTLKFDYYTSLLSLPYHLKTTYQKKLPISNYLKVAPKAFKLHKKKLFTTKKIKIGLSWQGDRNHVNDKNRSIALSAFYDIAGLPHVQCYALQKGYGVEQLAAVPPNVSIINLDPYLDDLTDTAAIIENLDVVITVDTAIAHLAGTLGKPVWLLLPYIVDWRWLGYSENEKSIWYPSLTKFRQIKTGDWNAPLADIIKKLSGNDLL